MVRSATSASCSSRVTAAIARTRAPPWATFFKNVAHGGARVLAIAAVTLDEQLALVAERTIKARPVHARGGREIVQRRRGETILAKQIERLAERDLRLVGARP